MNVYENVLVREASDKILLAYRNFFRGRYQILDHGHVANPGRMHTGDREIWRQGPHSILKIVWASARVGGTIALFQHHGENEARGGMIRHQILAVVGLVFPRFYDEPGRIDGNRPCFAGIM